MTNYFIRPTGKSDGWKTATGALFLLSTSGYFVTDKNYRQWPRIEFKVDEYKVVVDAPIRLAEPTWRPIPQMSGRAASRIFGSPNGDVPLGRSVAIQDIDDDGQLGNVLIWGDTDQPAENLPPDTLCICVHGEGALDHGPKIVEEFAERLFEWLRVITGQWWVGKPYEGVLGNLHFILPLEHERRTSLLPVSQLRQVKTAYLPARISNEIWGNAVERSRTRARPRSSEILMMDAIHLYQTRNFGTSIIVLASAFELSRDEVLSSKGVSKDKLKSGATDLLKHVSLDFEQHLQRNLKKERPELFEFLKSLWVARGHVAHGKEIYWRASGKRIAFSEISPDEFFKSSAELFDWFRDMKPE